eukprot:CAMPEP_0182504752 /NCGR_PEP_ID=MMETSP1321-20130603/17796_1 /TAXON_ID=91990 /ORGANISM="Bolidomonas sp., Strain RCC1657" /LENGTH=36 /DNA_ID= /DNA_START= /DNA_END= /DNA_ORIENTATION=
MTITLLKLPLHALTASSPKVAKSFSKDPEVPNDSGG